MTHRPLPCRAALAGLALVLAGCSAVPVGVSRADPTSVQRELTSNVLNSGSPSVLSSQVLQRQDLYVLWQRDPPAALAQLHETLGHAGGQYRLFALAELSYAHGEASGDRSRFLAAAVYAYALLFPGDAVNSIIAVDAPGPLEHASDGVVRYASAHVAGVESEKVVRSNHSAQGNPATIEEIRRILMVHLEQGGELTPPERTP